MNDAERAAFRADIRAWVEAHAPEGLRGTRQGRFDGYWGGPKTPPPTDDERAWLDAALERGFTAPTWPVEHGGGGLTRDQADILREELVRLKMPPPLVGFGLTMLGPTLLQFGDDAQKAAHLPPIIRGERRWCQGYSEPQAGSDLASLRTRAVREGDHFVVNGQKIWTSHADKSDAIFCLVRTRTEGKKQAGISFLLIDMATPGVSARPISLISGASPFCEVFFEDVRVPADRLVGGLNNGWTVAKALLGHERSMIGQAMGGQIAAAEGDLVALAREVLACPTGPLPDAGIRDAIARAALDQRAFDLTLRRIAEEAEAQGAPGPESSVLKVAGSELKQTRWDLAVRILGPDALGWEGPGFEDEALKTTRNWLRSRANTIEGGSSEIQLNIIAKRVLGLG
jgi:acyl-CoA dehydrogenase